MTTFLIILTVAMAMVLGQALMLRPSARDKGLMQLREAARGLGLQARLLPTPDWLKSSRSERLQACYTLFVPEGAAGLPLWRIEQVNAEWLTRAGDPAVLKRLVFPPEAAAVIAIETRANAVHMFWSESLGPEALSSLSALLFQVVEKMNKNQ